MFPLSVGAVCGTCWLWSVVASVMANDGSVVASAVAYDVPAVVHGSSVEICGETVVRGTPVETYGENYGHPASRACGLWSMVASVVAIDVPTMVRGSPAEIYGKTVFTSSPAEIYGESSGCSAGRVCWLCHLTSNFVCLVVRLACGDLRRELASQVYWLRRFTFEHILDRGLQLAGLRRFCLAHPA